MANSFDSNFTRKLARTFLKKFETSRVLSKNVDTQLLSGKFNPSSGENVDFKRPTDYTSERTAAGDISAVNAKDIITGKATGTVQDYFTVHVNYDEADEAIKMDQLDELLAPAAQRIVTDMEVDFAAYMAKNAGLLAGSPGTVVDTWADVAEAGAVMKAHGIPADAPWCYTFNPYTEATLANVQRSLNAGEQLASDAHRRAVVSENFAGMKVMTGTTLDTITIPNMATDRAGAINGTPTVTYAAAKDTMTQSIPVDGFGTFTGTVPAGTVIQITGRNRLNLSTRQPIVDGTGANVLFTGVLTADAALTSGAGTFVVSGPAIYEAAGAYNTVDSALADNDVVTILGGTDNATSLLQPNMFWHKQAFSIGSVPIKKLYSTDTVATTADGLQIRVSKYADGDKNQQKVRFDLRPAYATLNPFFAGQGFGKA